MARHTAVGRQRGVAFLAVLLIVAAMGATLASAGTFWHQIRQREKESELLFVGIQYQSAIRRYYEAVPGAQRYPGSLQDLLLDPRLPSIRRHLSRPWLDPLTGSAEWGLVKAPQGGIMGVYSLATGTPIKRAGFPARLGWKDGLERYADWRFVYQPVPVP